MAEVTLEEMIACVDREIGMREKVYPRWVENRKMLSATADKELERMRAVRLVLTGMATTCDHSFEGGAVCVKCGGRA